MNNEFDDVLEEIEISGGKEFKENVFLNKKDHFKIGKTREFVVTRGFATRQFFKNKTLICKSFDAKTGRKRTSTGWAKEMDDCSECGYAKGKNIGTDDQKDKIQCDVGYTLLFEHENPSKQYCLNINRSSYINLDKYKKELLKMGLVIQQVITGVTREESTKFNGSEFKFNFIRKIDLTYSDLEKEKLNFIITTMKNKQSDAQSVPFIADMLMKMKALSEVGLTKERALVLAKSIADDDDLISEDAEFIV
jgi:hypothetical protein